MNAGALPGMEESRSFWSPNLVRSANSTDLEGCVREECWHRRYSASKVYFKRRVQQLGLQDLFQTQKPPIYPLVDSPRCEIMSNMSPGPMKPRSAAVASAHTKNSMSNLS